MRKIAFVLTIALMGSILATSCKKDDNNKPVDTNKSVVGKWKTTLQGVDANNNKIWDQNEKKPVPAAEVLTFDLKSDGTMIVTDASGDNISGTYKVKSSTSKSITFEFPDRSESEIIDQQTDNSMVLRSIDKTKLEWEELAKVK